MQKEPFTNSEIQVIDESNKQRIFSTLAVLGEIELLQQRRSEQISKLHVSEILSYAMSAIAHAKSQVQLTMLLREELETPLPHRYHALLEETAQRGVKIYRVGFGSAEDSSIIDDRLCFSPHPNFYFTRISDTESHERLILIDNKQLIFSGDFFYSTTNEELVKAAQSYFSNFFYT